MTTSVQICESVNMLNSHLVFQHPLFLLMKHINDSYYYTIKQSTVILVSCFNLTHLQNVIVTTSFLFFVFFFFKCAAKATWICNCVCKSDLKTKKNCYIHNKSLAILLLICTKKKKNEKETKRN